MNPENKVIPSSCLGYYSHLPGQNSIPSHALQRENKTKQKTVMTFTVGMKQRPRCVLSEHQALADVLMSSHNLMIDPHRNKSMFKVKKFCWGENRIINSSR